MFVRVVTGRNESFYECRRYHIKPESDDTFFMHLENDSTRNFESIVLQIDKKVPESLGVYVMNDSGQTIDTVFRKNED